MSSANQTLLHNLPDSFTYINQDTKTVSETVFNEAEDCFMAMSSNWQKGHYKKVLELANKQSIHCLCDIRISVYYLYSYWVTQTVTPTEVIVCALADLLNHEQRPWKATLKLKKDHAADAVLTNSVVMLLRKIIDHLGNPHTIRNPKDESPTAVLSASERILSITNKLIAKPNKELSSAATVFNNYYTALAKALPSPAADEELNKQEDVDTEIVPKENQLAHLDTDLSMPQTLLDPTLFSPSHALLTLFQHILLLEKLIDKQQPLKAAVVLCDIQEELDNFNPMHYFPEFFKPLASMRAQHGKTLEPFFNEQDSYQWKILKDCYKTDIQAFLEVPEDSAESPFTSAHHTDAEYYE